MSDSPRHWRDTLTLRRSVRARHIRFRVHPWGGVEVVVPQRFDERRLPGLIAQQQEWVERTLARLAATNPLSRTALGPPQSLALRAIGEQWHLEYLPGAGGRYGCREGGEGVLRLAAGEGWRDSLRRWLARKGRDHLLPWLEQVSEELALPFSGATIRGQKSRWGSCSASGHININYALLFLEPRLVRHLFVHELCHTVHHNHSARYWRLVGQLSPDYRELERALREATSQLPPWLHAPLEAL